MLNRRAFLRTAGATMASAAATALPGCFATKQPEPVNSSASQLDVESERNKLENEFIDRANKLFGEGNWIRADNFSYYYVAILRPIEGYVNTNESGTIATNDPTAQNDTDPSAADNSVNYAKFLMVPISDKMENEFTVAKDKEQAHDAYALWMMGQGDIRITYLGLNEGTLEFNGRINERRFVGLRNKTPISRPASFQTTRFDGSLLIEAPESIIVEMHAQPGDYCRMTTGPTSFDDSDGAGNKDWQDQGNGFDD